MKPNAERGLEFAIACARKELRPQDREAARALLAGGDARELLAAAEWHAVWTLAATHALAEFPELLAGELRAELQSGLESRARRKMALAAGLLRVVELLDGAGIPVLPYKGPALAATAYGNVALREYSDLDVITERKYVRRAVEVLQAAGFAPDPGLGLTSRELAVYLHNSYVIPVREGGTTVEVHWQAAPHTHALEVGFGGLWHHAKPTPLGGRLVRMLSAEDHFRLVCIHGAKEMWERVSMAADAAALVQAGEKKFDWVRVLGRAQRRGSMRIVLLGATLAEALGAKLPAKVREAAARDSRVAELAEQVRRNWLAQVRSDAARGMNHRFWWKARERWRDRMRYGLRLAFEPSVNDYRAVPLPRFLWAGYAVVRPVRMGWAAVTGGGAAGKP